ncbi:MAG: hypothetical protein JXQ75_07350 [Phycisphaerae bacterium]|nr:hypothetical protein [Phycisphaerae bacterium]
MRIDRRGWGSRCWGRVAFLAAVVCASAVGPFGGSSYGQDSAGLKTRTGNRPIRLWPPAEDKPSGEEVGQAIDLGGWTYRAVKSPNPRDGVPWELIVTPSGENAKTWHKGSEDGRALPAAVIARGVEEPEKDPESIPVVEIPATVWKQWMEAELRTAVGVHFHEFVTDDVARILYTVHQVPPDGPDGKPPPPGSYHGRSGARVEATLLSPVMFSLDQTVAVRKDPLREALLASRIQHEVGHAKESQEVLLQVMRGPQDWNPEYCTGRRSRVVYYWKREQIGRSWDNYRGGVGKILTLRTSVVLVPPTRWSLLLPIPSERVTQRHLQAFNDAIVMLAPRFAKADREAQDRFHARYGAFEHSAP